MKICFRDRYMGNFRSFIPSLIALMALGLESEVAEAIHPLADEAPTLPERLSKDIVKGRLMRVEGEHVVIKVANHQEIKLHVDLTTKMGEVMAGDKIKAYVDDRGHVTTLQRDE
jgi:hypothetical protein